MLLLIHYYLIKYKSLKYLNISKWMEITIIVIKGKKFHVIFFKNKLIYFIEEMKDRIR